MCHSDASRAPAPPRDGGLGDHGRLRLTATDDNEFDAYEAHPAVASDVGIVVLPDVRGLHPYYLDLAEQLARAGYHCVTIDYFGRTAETDDRSEAFQFWPHVQQTTPEGVTHDVAAGVAHLRSAEGGSVRSVCTLGFCFGGRHSLRQSATIDGLSGAVAFYGNSALVDDVVDQVQAPLLILLGGADENIPTESFDPLRAALRPRGIDVQMHVYDGAPHSFFDRSFADHRDACEDAWLRVIDFVDAASGRVAASS
jgi:carboxymethylenebutenolidase